MQQTIPLTDLTQYPPIVRNNSEGDFGGGLRVLDRFTSEHRATLVDSLAFDLRRWGAPQAALDAANLLREPGSYAVVTGQQAGIATGPLYTLYKAIGAVRMAARLAEQNPAHRFVPVFWTEGDDHDFNEARQLTLLDRDTRPATLRYDDGNDRPLHVGDRTVSAEGLDRLIDELRNTLIQTEFTPATLTLLRDCYGPPGSTLADGFARSLYAMLGDTALVVVSSRNATIKKLATDVFEKEALEPDRLFHSVRKRTDELLAAGEDTPVEPKRGALFMTHDGERRSLDLNGDLYTVRGTSTTMSLAEAAALAREHPERFSPNVLLRPIVQDAALPTAIYLGGPSELAYLAQVRDGYAEFGLEPSMAAPRPFVLLLEAKAKKVLENSGLSLSEILAQDFEPASSVIGHDADQEILDAVARALEGVQGALGGLEPLATRIDPTLEKSLAAVGAGARKGVEDFGKRLRSALKKKSQTEIDRLDTVRSLLMPGGKLQERVLSPIYYLNKFGPERFRAALETIELRPGELQVVEI